MLQEEFFLRFAEFEEMVKEHDRARAIFKYALDHLPKAAAQQLYARLVAFEKQHGSRWAFGGTGGTGYCPAVVRPFHDLRFHC